MKTITCCIYNDHKYLLAFEKSAACSITAVRTEFLFEVI